MLVATSTHQALDSRVQRDLLSAAHERGSVGSYFYGYWFSHERA